MELNLRAQRNMEEKSVSNAFFPDRRKIAQNWKSNSLREEAEAFIISNTVILEIKNSGYSNHWIDHIREHCFKKKFFLSFAKFTILNFNKNVSKCYDIVRW